MKSNNVMVQKKIYENGNRPAILLSHDTLRLVIDLEKGMIPEQSIKRENGWLNAHWNPWFRSNSGELWNEEVHSEFWKSSLMYDIAGNFPCVPNFGPDYKTEDYIMPAHGFTAAEKWKFIEKVKEDNFYTGFKSVLNGNKHPFHYEKIDLIIKDHNSHYSLLDITNTGFKPEPFNYAWHNTIGFPFLESGCLIDNSADIFMVPPEGSEFDDTGRLEFAAKTDSLERVPLRDGGIANLRKVPGVIGYTDFISGAVSRDCKLAWNSVVNPRLKMVYLSFSLAPASCDNGKLPLYFHDIWMNYGGRPFSPWAAADGLTDQSFCLGVENATGYFANGLQLSKKNPELMGNPTYQVLFPGERKSLFYGTLIDIYKNDSLDNGIKEVEPEGKYLVLKGYNGKSTKIETDWNFSVLKSTDCHLSSCRTS